MRTPVDRGNPRSAQDAPGQGDFRNTGGPRRGEGGGPDDVDDDPRRPPRPKSKWQHKTLIIVGAVLLVISVATLSLVYGLSSRYEHEVNHEAICDPTICNASPAIDGPLNYLVLGTDSRAAVATQSDQGGANSDTIMIAHVSKGLKEAFIVSVPRDSYVDIPASGSWHGGRNKINAAFAYGGAALMAKTLVQLSGIKFDGVVIVNFAGIQKMVDAVGGVHVCPPYDVPNFFRTDFPQYNRGWKAGQCYDMMGEEAEVFVRQRHDVPGGDFGRMKSQQLVIKALAQKATSAGIIANPVKLDALLVTAAQSLTIDESMNLRDLAFALKGITPDDLKFASLPHSGTDSVDSQGVHVAENGTSIVRLNPTLDQELFQAILNDTADDWLAKHPQSDVASYEPTK